MAPGKMPCASQEPTGISCSPLPVKGISPIPTPSTSISTTFTPINKQTSSLVTAQSDISASRVILSPCHSSTISRRDALETSTIHNEGCHLPDEDEGVEVDNSKTVKRKRLKRGSNLAVNVRRAAEDAAAAAIVAAEETQASETSMKQISQHLPDIKAGRRTTAKKQKRNEGKHLFTELDVTESRCLDGVDITSNILLSGLVSTDPILSSGNFGSDVSEVVIACENTSKNFQATDKLSNDDRDAENELSSCGTVSGELPGSDWRKCETRNDVNATESVSSIDSASSSCILMLQSEGLD